MKSYNQILVGRLRGGTYGLNRIPLCFEAADIIEDQEAEIELWKEDFQEAMEVSKISVATMKIAANRILELEKALRYIHDNPHAHPENVKWVVKDALGLK